MKIVACIIARTNSTRLPHKILRNVYEKDTLLDVLIERTKKVSQLDTVYIATSDQAGDDILEDYANIHGIKIYRGSADNVIARLIDIGKQERASHIIRITGDNIFTDHTILQYQISKHLENNWQYSRVEGVPLGSTAEVINYETLVDCERRINPNESEYMMLYLFDPTLYKVGIIQYNMDKLLNQYTLTVDTLEDLIRSRNILSITGDKFISTSEIITCIKENQIENSIMKVSSTIKLPGNETISFDQFRAEMDERVKKSHIIQYCEE